MAAPSSGSAQVPGPPYPPHNLGLGGTPDRIPDVPISAVFLALFTLGAAAHMGLFQFNLHKRKKKFAFNAATFGFCFTRIIATSLRIAWSYSSHNVALGLAAQIFVYAGIPVLFVVNLFWAQRIVRAQHPGFGWSKPFSAWLPILIVLAVLTVFALIAAIVVQFYVLGQYVQDWTRGIQLYGATFFAITAFLPIPIELISTLAGKYSTSKGRAVDNFGSGGIASKITISTISAILLSLGAWYRAGTSYLTPIPVTQPAPADFSKPAFYIFNFTIEVLVVYAWLLLRVDRRYIVPDGAKGPYSYGNGFVFAGELGNEKNGNDGASSSTRHLTCASGEGIGSIAYYSVRSSVATLPAPRLSRADSWGSVTPWASRTDVDKPPTTNPAAKLRHSMSALPRRSRADSTDSSQRISMNEIVRPRSVGADAPGTSPTRPGRAHARAPSRLPRPSAEYAHVTLGHYQPRKHASLDDVGGGGAEPAVDEGEFDEPAYPTVPSPVVTRARSTDSRPAADRHDGLDDDGDLHPALRFPWG